ncbi:MAG TPA: phosphotransferase family protein [Ilumatobacteraceae bacterium]|nr:phosphotransferase family protein [Ilumatobacteraceae bacterium]
MESSAVGTELSTMLSQLLDGAAIHGLHRLSGGASRETWRFEADSRPLILQRQRSGDGRDMLVEAGVVRAVGRSGAPVPELIDARRRDDGMSFMVLEAIEGETIARKILRDDDFATARARLVGDLGRALARIHAIDLEAVPGLQRTDQIEYYTSVLDDLGQPHPVLELVRNWLIDTRPTSEQTSLVHGDFRLGNLIVGPDGLRAVIDWELAHVGDPMEDLGWLCVKAWRFGAEPPVAGLGDYDELFAAYESAGGAPVDPVVVHWWEVLGTWKWAIMCIVQASVHLSGAARSHELAAIGRRVCENEHDLLLALDGRW